MSVSYGKTAAAPVFGRSALNGISSRNRWTGFGAGTSTMGRPAADLSFFHFCHGDPPAMSMSSWKMVEDNFWFKLSVRVAPSSDTFHEKYVHHNKILSPRKGCMK